MGIVSRNNGATKRSARSALIIAAAAGAAACMGRSAQASVNYLVDPSWAGTDGQTNAVDGGVTYAAVYKSVASALGAVPAVTNPVNNGASVTNPNVIYIDPGTYFFNTTISYSKANVALIGVSGNANDVVISSSLDSDYNGGATTGNTTIGTTNSATIQLKGNNQTVMNVTFANTTDTPYIVTSHLAVAPNGAYVGSAVGTTTVQTASAPAVALLTQGDEQAFINVKVLGYQDTLYMKGGRNYYTNSTVSGDNDFIFANGTSVFTNSTINIDGDHSGGAVTAASTFKTTSNGIVFINDTITSNSVKGSIIDVNNGASATGAAPNTMSLGRSWGWQQTGGDASVVYINDKITNAIRTAGWLTWNNNETNAANGHNGGNPGEDSRFAEYNSMDLSGNPLDVSSRVSWSHQLTTALAAAYNIPVADITGNTALDVISNIFKSEFNATTNPNGFAWYGNGYADPNSFPTFWGSRNATNDNGSEAVGLLGNPTAYTDGAAGTTTTNWVQATTGTPNNLQLNWDPFVQVEAVPEPATLSLLGGGAAMLLMRRNKKEATETK